MHFCKSVSCFYFFIRALCVFACALHRTEQFILMHSTCVYCRLLLQSNDFCRDKMNLFKFYMALIYYACDILLIVKIKLSFRLFSSLNTTLRHYWLVHFDNASYERIIGLCSGLSTWLTPLTRVNQEHL